MTYGAVAGIEKRISRVVQGCMMLREGDGQSWTNDLLDAAFSQGITAFDLGWVYGRGACERAFGEWIRHRQRMEDSGAGGPVAGYARNEIVILDKGCHPSNGLKRVTPKDIRSDVEDSLERLNTPYIDLWMFHRDDPDQPVGPLVQMLNEMIEEGAVHAIGASNWTRERIEEANEYAYKNDLVPLLASSPNFSLAEQVESPWGPDCVTISGPANRDVRAWYRDEGMPVFTWSSLARGFLSGRVTRSNFDTTRTELEDHTIRCYVTDANWERLARLERLAGEMQCTVAQLALAYVLNQPFNAFALVGAFTPDEIRANREATEIRLSPDELRWLDLEIDDRPQPLPA